MKPLTLQEMGEVIRKVRKQRGLRLEDLSDDNISPATVSNIERGVAHVSPEKITYLLEKLQLSKNHLPEILGQEKKDLKKLTFRFLTISTLHQIGLPDEALAQLDSIQMDDNHPLIAKIHYYKGRCYLLKKKWKQAERSFYNAIRYAKQNAYSETNIEAACYLYLSCSSLKQKKFEQASLYTNHGIEVFTEDKGQLYIKYHLYLNKLIYLKKTTRITEGYRFLQDIWESIHLIENIDITLQFYIMRSDFAEKAGLLDEAIHYATDGIRLAKRNKNFDKMFKLWLVLGNSYLASGDWELSESCYLMTLRQTTSKRSIIVPYIRLGILYFKQNQPERAYQVLMTGRQYAKQGKHMYHQCVSLLILGDICLSLDQPQQALDFYQQGLDIAEKNQYQGKKQQFWLRLAKYWEQKDENHFQECVKNLYQLQKQEENFTIEVDKDPDAL